VNKDERDLPSDEEACALHEKVIHLPACVSDGVLDIVPSFTVLVEGVTVD